MPNSSSPPAEPVSPLTIKSHEILVDKPSCVLRPMMSAKYLNIRQIAKPHDILLCLEPSLPPPPGTISNFSRSISSTLYNVDNEHTHIHTHPLQHLLWTRTPTPSSRRRSPRITYQTRTTTTTTPPPWGPEVSCAGRCRVSNEKAVIATAAATAASTAAAAALTATASTAAGVWARGAQAGVGARRTVEPRGGGTRRPWRGWKRRPRREKKRRRRNRKGWIGRGSCRRTWTTTRHLVGDGRGVSKLGGAVVDRKEKANTISKRKKSYYV